MQKINSKTLVLILGLVLPTVWCMANISGSLNEPHPIYIIESNVQGVPRGSTIQASINGHYLTVTFTQYIGNVTMELDQSSGAMIFCNQVATPDCCQYYLPLTGDYILTFTLSNGDEYYGEFSITD
jgi:hypothetical protein